MQRKSMLSVRYTFACKVTHSSKYHFKWPGRKSTTILPRVDAAKIKCADLHVYSAACYLSHVAVSQHDYAFGLTSLNN